MDQQTPIVPEWPLHVEGAELEAFRDECHRRAAELREQAVDDAFSAAGAAVRMVWAFGAQLAHAVTARSAAAKVRRA